MNDSKELIAAAALSLFARKGFESAGVNEIAEMTGLAKPSLYHHFGSKDGLLKAIIETRGQELLSLTEGAAAYKHDLTGNLQTLFRENIGFARSREDFFRLLLRLFASPAETPGYETGAEFRGKLIKIYRELFLEASKDHGNMRGRERIYAETFWGLIAACAALDINGVMKLDPPSQYRIVHQYMHGIFS